MILSATHITKSFGSETIIRDASLLINEHEKVAIVGLNGAGKTTLLRILSIFMAKSSKNSMMTITISLTNMNWLMAMLQEVKSLEF